METQTPWPPLDRRSKARFLCPAAWVPTARFPIKCNTVFILHSIHSHISCIPIMCHTLCLTLILMWFITSREERHYTHNYLSLGWPYVSVCLGQSWLTPVAWYNYTEPFLFLLNIEVWTVKYMVPLPTYPQPSHHINKPICLKNTHINTCGVINLFI